MARRDHEGRGYEQHAVAYQVAIGFESISTVGSWHIFPKTL